MLVLREPALKESAHLHPSRVLVRRTTAATATSPPNSILDTDGGRCDDLGAVRKHVLEGAHSNAPPAEWYRPPQNTSGRFATSYASRSTRPMKRT